MSIKHILTYTTLLLLISACETEPDPNKTEPITINKFSGYIQKGPFLNGTAITISELTEEFNLTGNTYNTEILDNSGNFSLNNIELESSYVELKADGFYFDEVRNENSDSQLSLYALGDVSENSSMNVNVLSHLERNRVNYLLSEGMSFENAKKQATSEILTIFEFDEIEIPNSETLDISKDGDENAILLALSVILQGNLSVPDFSELLANINTDIRQDGVLNSQKLGESLVNNAYLLDPKSIRSNLEDRYSLLGIDVTIPPFESYLDHFLKNTSFQRTNEIEYPVTGAFGENLLANDKSIYQGGNYCLSAFLPNHTSLKVKLDGHGCYLNNNPYDESNRGWDVKSVANQFSSTMTGQIDLWVTLGKMPPEYDEDSIIIEKSTIFELQVFENKEESATWCKTIEVK